MRLNDLFNETLIDEKYKPLYEKSLKVFEAPAADAAFDTMMGTIENLKDTQQIDPTVADQVITTITQAWKKAKQSYQGQMGRRKQITTKNVRGKVEKEYQEFHTELQDTLDLIAKKIDGYKDDPQEKRTAKQQATAMARLAQIKDSIDSLFVDPNVLNPETREGSFSREDILGFLKACLEGEVLDMKELVAVKNGTGYIQDFVKGDYLPMYNFLIEKGLLQLTMSGTTGGNVGPGEFALAMIGSPAEKGKKGDLKVDGVEYELKAGNLGKMKSGKRATSTGGRMNSGLINTGRAAGNLIVSGIKNYIPDWGNTKFKKWIAGNIKPQLKPPGLPGLGVNGIKDWNNIFKTFNVSGDNVEGLLGLILKSIISNMDDVVKATGMNVRQHTRFRNKAKAVVLNKGAIDQAVADTPAPRTGWDAPEDAAVSRGTIGQFNYNALMELVTRLTYTSYQQAEGVERIMFINKINGSFQIIKDADEFIGKMRTGHIVHVKGVSFTDKQQKATLHYTSGETEVLGAPTSAPPVEEAAPKEETRIPYNYVV